MTVNNMKQLEQALLNKAKKAMEAASADILADMREGTNYFYTGNKPQKYNRTDALRNTPRTSVVSVIGNEISFNAYLDKSHSYTNGSNPSMAQVLNLANYGIPFTTKNGYPSRATVGQKGFWERAEKKMQKSLVKNMKKFFT